MPHRYESAGFGKEQEEDAIENSERLFEQQLRCCMATVMRKRPQQ